MPPQTKLTDQVRIDIGKMMQTGVDPETCARAAGVTLRTFQRWLERGFDLRVRQDEGKRIRAEDRPYLELLDEIEVAAAAAEVRAVAVLDRAAQNGVWQAAAWKLERLIAPEKYGGARRPPGRPKGATSAPDRPSTAEQPPPRIRLQAVK